jgi:hypothetical protein
MSDFRFLKYEPTPSEKHMGIATVMAYGKIILRYKIVQNKDGTGFFPASASYKMSDPSGADFYVSAFVVDSNGEKEELENMIKANVRAQMTPRAFPENSFANPTMPMPPQGQAPLPYPNYSNMPNPGQMGQMGQQQGQYNQQQQQQQSNSFAGLNPQESLPF